MAKKKKAGQAKQNKHQKPAEPDTIKYKQMTLEILFTDGQVETVTFYNPENLLRFMAQIIRTHFADSIRIELF